MKKHKLLSIVSTKETRAAYYSNYGGNPVCEFTPDDIGYISGVDIPAVYHKTGFPNWFYLVDFMKYNQLWRVNLYHNEIKIIKPDDIDLDKLPINNLVGILNVFPPDSDARPIMCYECTEYRGVIS